MPNPRLALSSRQTIQLLLIVGLLHVAASQYRTRIRPGQTPTYRRRPDQSTTRQRVSYRRPQVTLRTQSGNAIQRMEEEISKMKLSMEGMETRLRVTLSATLSQRLKTVSQEIRKNDDRIRKAEDTISRLSQQLGNLGSQATGMGGSAAEAVSQPVTLDLLAVRKSIVQLEDKVANLTSKDYQNRVVTTQLRILQEEHAYLKGIAATTSTVSQRVSELEERNEEQGRIVDALEKKLTGIHNSVDISEEITQLKRNITVLSEQKEARTNSVSQKLSELEARHDEQERIVDALMLNLTNVHKSESIVKQIAQIKQNITVLAKQQVVVNEVQHQNLLTVNNLENDLGALQEKVTKNTIEINVISTKGDRQEVRLEAQHAKLENVEHQYKVLENNVSSHNHHEIQKQHEKIAAVEQAVRTNTMSLFDFQQKSDRIVDSLQQLNWTVAQAAAYNSEYGDITDSEVIGPDFVIYPESSNGDYTQPTVLPKLNSLHGPPALDSAISLSDMQARLTNLETKASFLDSSYEEVYRKTEENENNINTDKSTTTRLAEKVEESLSLLALHQNTIQNLNGLLTNASKRMDNFTSAFALVRAAFNRIEARDKEHTISIRVNRRAVEALASSVRDVTQAGKRQNSAIGNLRRRIRSMEGIDFNAFATLEELYDARQNLSSRLTSLQQDLRVLGDALSQQGGESLGESNEWSSAIQKLIADMETNDNRVEQLAKAVAYLMNASSPGSVLESEFESYISVIQTIPQIQEDVNGLIKMRNVVLKNSADVNQLHDLYEGTQTELVKLKGTSSNLEFETVNLKKTDENIRSNYEESINLYSELSGSVSELRNELTLLTYSVDINVTAVEGDVKTLYARFADTVSQRHALESGLNGLDVALKDFKREAELKTAEQGLSMLQITKKLENVDLTMSTISEIQRKATVKTEGEIASMLTSFEEDKKALQLVTDDLAGASQDIENLQQTDLRRDSEFQLVRQKVDRFQSEINRQKNALNTHTAGIQNNNELVADLQRQTTLQKSKIESFEAGLEGIRHSVSQQANTSFVTQKIDTECSAKIGSIEQKVQEHEAFVRRAEESISNHHVDIHTMLLRSSNHTAALRMLKERLKDDNTANLTRDILYELSHLERTIQVVTNDITSLQAKDNARRLTTSEIQSNLHTMQSSVWKSESDIRQQTTSIETLRLDLNSKAKSQRTLSGTVRAAQETIRNLQQDILSHTNDIISLRDANNGALYTAGILENSLRATSNKTRELQSSINSLFYEMNVMNMDIRGQKLALQGLDGRVNSQTMQLQEQQNNFYVMKAEAASADSEIQRMKDSLKSFDGTRTTLISLNGRTTRMQTSIANFEDKSNINKGIITRMYSELNQTVSNFNRIISSLAEEKRKRFEQDQETSSKIHSLQSDVSQVHETCSNALENLSTVSEKADLLKSQLEEFEEVSSQRSKTTARALADKVSNTVFNNSLVAIQNDVKVQSVSLESLKTNYDELSTAVGKNSRTNEDISQRLSEHEDASRAHEDLQKFVEDRLQNQNKTLQKILRGLLVDPWTREEQDGNISISGDNDSSYDFVYEDQTSYYRVKNVFDEPQV